MAIRFQLRDVCGRAAPTGTLLTYVIFKGHSPTNDNSGLIDNNAYKLYSDVQDIPCFQYVPPLLNSAAYSAVSMLKAIDEKQKYCNYAFPLRCLRIFRNLQTRIQVAIKSSHDLQLTTGMASTQFFAPKGFVAVLPIFFKQRVML